MKWEEVKSAAEKTLISASGYENYASGGCKARYQGGRHGVIIAMTVFSITKMAKVKEVIDKAEEGVKEGMKKTDLISVLSGSIKSTYDDLIKAGLKSEIKGNSILLKNASNETVAIITNGKLTPAKWSWHINSLEPSKIYTSEGYIIIKNGNNITFDLGFKEGRKLEAKEVNDYLVHGQKKDLDGQPYWAGTQVDEIILGRKGETIYFVENYNGGVPNPGQFGSKEAVVSIKELREKLAVKEAWKKTVDEPTLRAYRVKTNLRARSGIIGRQSDNGMELPGGGHQYEIIDYMGEDWKKYLEPIGDETGNKLE